jgi:hypothetical protein
MVEILVIIRIVKKIYFYKEDSIMDIEKDQIKEKWPMVDITIDSNKVSIHRGNQSVAEIKHTGNIPLAFDLEQVVNGKLVPLSDNGSLTIKGDEIFISHPKDASSS